jgi:hypothetical protein
LILMEDSKVTKLPKSPEGNARAELAAALKEAAKARTALNKHRAGVNRLFEQMMEAEAAIEPAEKAVKLAEQSYVDAVAEAAVSGSPAPVNGKAKAEARLVLTKDRVNVLREARRRLESELPDWQQDVVDADVAVERKISLVIADHVRVLLAEASEIARRLAPYRAALAAFAADNMDRPRAWNEQASFDKGRAPLDETAAAVWSFFRELRQCDAGPSNPWAAIRERLRANPEAAVLRHLAQEFSGLFDRPSDEPRPASPAS